MPVLRLGDSAQSDTLSKLHLATRGRCQQLNPRVYGKISLMFGRQPKVELDYPRKSLIRLWPAGTERAITGSCERDGRRRYDNETRRIPTCDTGTFALRIGGESANHQRVGGIFVRR